MVIGILLACYNNKQVFDWNGVTLNAIVAIFSAVSKSLLANTISECLGQSKWIWFAREQRHLSDLDLIDSASRGPLGSLKILGKPLAYSFISFSAILVLLSTAIDPFMQLTIGKKEIVNYNTNELAQIAYAQRYSKGTRLPDLNGSGYVFTTCSIQST